MARERPSPWVIDRRVCGCVQYAHNEPPTTWWVIASVLGGKLKNLKLNKKKTGRTNQQLHILRVNMWNSFGFRIIAAIIAFTIADFALDNCCQLLWLYIFHIIFFVFFIVFGLFILFENFGFWRRCHIFSIQK